MFTEKLTEIEFATFYTKISCPMRMFSYNVELLCHYSGGWKLELLIYVYIYNFLHNLCFPIGKPSRALDCLDS